MLVTQSDVGLLWTGRDPTIPVDEQMIGFRRGENNGRNNSCRPVDEEAGDGSASDFLDLNATKFFGHDMI